MNNNDCENLFNCLSDAVQEINKYDPIIIAYRQARKIHQEVINSMCNYIDKNHLSPEEILLHIEDKLDLEIFEIDFNNKLDTHIYCDLIIYPYISSIKSICEHYLEKHIFRKVEKIQMLEAMKNSYLGFFEIIDRDDLKATTLLKNVVTKEEITLMDFNLGAFKTGINTYIFLRIINYQGINFQTGLSMPFSRNGTTKAWIKRNRQNFINNDSACIIVNLFGFYQKYGLPQPVIR